MDKLPPLVEGNEIEEFDLDDVLSSLMPMDGYATLRSLGWSFTDLTNGRIPEYPMEVLERIADERADTGWPELDLSAIQRKG